MGIQKIVAVFSLLGILVGYQNCNKVNFTSIANNPNSQSITPAGGGTNTTIRQFQPALAVRDISCLSCHANIQANVITDFGSPNSWYMGGLASPTDFGGLHYEATTWQTLAQVNGQVIVPSSATVPNSYVQSQLQSGSTAPTGPISLMTYLSLTSMSNFGGSWYSYFGEKTPATFAFANNVNGGPTMTPISPQATVYIGAPTAQQILAIIPTNTTPGPWVQVMGASTTGLSGLSVTAGLNGQQYITNSGTVQCSNLDVVVNGTLLLNNAQIYAENGGCRFYVTGSVFIEGPVTYLNSGAAADPSDNLQITSATSIIMGVGLNGSALNGDGSTDQSGSTPLKVRLISDVRGNLLLRGATTSTAYTTFANGILAEGTNIGLPLLQDASVVPNGATTALSAAKQSRVAINFQHLLLNAPLIHSRYMGTVNGVIVSESAMFSLGEFSFNYDPVFQNVAVLPALPYDILCTGTPCNPANP